MTPPQRIGVLAWGSLVWAQGDLRTDSRWHNNGPVLPLEFARESTGPRVTLVIVDGYEHLSTTYWAVSSEPAVDLAGSNLRARERNIARSDIHILERGKKPRSLGVGPGPSATTTEAIADWLASPAASDLGAVIWTGLPPKRFDPSTGPVALSEQVIAFLDELHPDNRLLSQEYFERAPEAIDTPVRRAVMEHFQWTRRVLDPTLFELSPIVNQ